MNGENVGDESGYEDERQNDPMAAEAVEEDIAGGDRDDKCGVEPEEHTHVIRRPEVLRDPFNKAAVHERLVKDVHNI